MTDIFDEVRDGTLGHFWTDLTKIGELGASDSGYVRLMEDGHFRIEVLSSHRASTHWMKPDAMPPHDSVTTLYAATHAAGCVFFDVSLSGRSSIMGATRASVDKYRAGGVLAGKYLGDIASDKFTQMQIKLPGVYFWSGIGGVRGVPERDEEARATSYSVKLQSSDPLWTPERRGIKLSLSSRWSAFGPHDKKTLTNPLAITTESKKPRNWADHIVPLLAVQNLINLAYQGYVAADVGTALIETVSKERPLSSADFYFWELMHVRLGTKPPKSMTEPPTFCLVDINGMKGVDAWIRLEQQHPRATGPLAKVYRFGDSLAIETRLMEVAVAIEYWICAHRRTTKWALVKKNENPYSLALYVGKAFEELVGDIRVWSKIFREAYNDLKHNPRFKYSVAEIYAIARSGEILLQCALLNQIAGNKRLTRIICEDRRSHDMGEQLREIVQRGHL
jgi:hypothetical protein